MAVFIVYPIVVTCPQCKGWGYSYGELTGRVCEYCYSAGECEVTESRLQLNVPLWATQDWASFIATVTRPASTLRRRRRYG